MVTVQPRVFTIASGLPFLPTLAQALLGGAVLPEWPRSDDPLALSEATIYVPTRRAARAFLNELATGSGTEALLLPRVVPLGGLEDVEDRVILESGFAAFDQETALLPDIDPVRRRLILTRLVLAWSKHISQALADQHPMEFGAALVDGWRDDPQGFIVAATPHDAVDLADALGTLIDTLVIYGKTWSDVHKLVPVENDDYWRISRNFLEIAAASWPALKEAEGVMDMAERRHRLLTLEAERLTKTKPTTPIIAAGSTGSMPATAALLSAIARLPRGAVILPDLDQGLDETSFASLTKSDGQIREPSHPQAQLAHLLKYMGLSRQDVHALGHPSRDAGARMILLSEAMRPAETEFLGDTCNAERLAREPAKQDVVVGDIVSRTLGDVPDERVMVAVVLDIRLPTEPVPLTREDTPATHRLEAEAQTTDARKQVNEGERCLDRRGWRQVHWIARIPVPGGSWRLPGARIGTGSDQWYGACGHHYVSGGSRNPPSMARRTTSEPIR